MEIRKKIGILALSLICSLYGFTQTTFSIIHVKGQVKVKSTGKLLERGMKISDKEVLIYGSSSDLVAAISPDKGKVIIQPDTKTKSSGGELAYVIRDIYKPMQGNATTRGSSLLSTAGIITFFTAGYLVLDNNEFEFNKNQFLLNEKSFFFIRYQAEGQTEPINKKLVSSNGKVILNRTEFLSIDGKLVAPDDLSVFELYYFADDSANKIAEMNLYLPPIEVIKSVLEIIKRSEIENAFSESMQYMQIAYGNVDPVSLEMLYNE
jgi:hypothetical protein